MNWKHLIWVVPIAVILGMIMGFIIGIPVGIELGFESIPVMEEFACQICIDTMELCTEMLDYSLQYNGTTQEAIQQYVAENNETIFKMFEDYGITKEMMEK